MAAESFTVAVLGVVALAVAFLSALLALDENDLGHHDGAWAWFGFAIVMFVGGAWCWRAF